MKRQFVVAIGAEGRKPGTTASASLWPEEFSQEHE